MQGLSRVWMDGQTLSATQSDQGVVPLAQKEVGRGQGSELRQAGCEEEHTSGIPYGARVTTLGCCSLR